MVEFPSLPEGQIFRGVKVWTNRRGAGGLMETTAEFMAVCQDDTPEFKRQILANLVATYNGLKIEIKPGELEAIRKHYGF